MPGLRRLDVAHGNVPVREHRGGRTVSVLVDRLRRVGGYVTEQELRFQLGRHDGLILSNDELANQMRHLELAGHVDVRVSYKALPQGEAAARPRRSPGRAAPRTKAGR